MSVCSLSGSQEFFSETIHRISLIFCNKLALSKSKKVTKPDFQTKLFGPDLGKLVPNLPEFEVSGKLFKFESLNFSDFAYYNLRDMISHRVILWLKKH